MSDLKEQVKQLRATIFHMLNYANMYVLVLDEKMEVKFANNSLAQDLGFNDYNDLLGKCWLDFIQDQDRQQITTIHAVIAEGKEWKKYREFQNCILGSKGNIIVHWFNSHINSDYNWTFSFGIRKEPQTQVTMESIRSYYRDIVANDRTMINSMKDMILLRERVVNPIVDSCEPNFDVGENNEGSLSF